MPRWSIVVWQLFIGLVVYGLFLGAMFWMYKRFNDKMFKEAAARIRRQPDIEIPV